MNRPDFAEIAKLLHEVEELGGSYEEIFGHREELEETVREACRVWRVEAASSGLADLSVEELKTGMPGIRTAALQEAGYETMLDLHRAADAELLGIPGIGEKSLLAIRAVTDELRRSLAERVSIVLDVEEPGRADKKMQHAKGIDRAEGSTKESHRVEAFAKASRSLSLIQKIYRLRRYETIEPEAAVLREELRETISQVTSQVVIRSRFRWFFARRRDKEATVAAVGELIGFCRGPLCARAKHFVGAYREAMQAKAEAAREDFGRNGAAYYAAIEKLAGSALPEELIYRSIPAGLAAKIREEELNLSGFRGDLRAYQDFGARYILCQKRVLLGDEMGLGKTIQAIAAMAHLYVTQPDCYFLVVCPASVMINWCREIRKFSGIDAHLIHGPMREEALARWQETGGAAVTSYEGMEKIVGKIDGAMTLALLVIDEAHYIKNPQAQRTKNIRRLEDESERILLMTGTPLENRVDEMCELIGFVRPDLAEEIRKKAVLQHLPEFREMLAPAYLRRQRDQVLTELPPLTEQEEWCAMTEADREAYAEQVRAKQFAAMRRVSFLQEDMSTSAKGLRLRELCEMAVDEGRKVVVFSYFRETIRKAQDVLADVCAGSITGSTPAADRQFLIDRFGEMRGGAVLICQIQSGGTGLNLQMASVVIFCEPQIKPSFTNQALSRVYRMGQIRNVLVCHLLCERTVDEAVRALQDQKQTEFDFYAEESALAEAAEMVPDREWIRRVIEQERSRYLPAVVEPVSAGE